MVRDIIAPSLGNFMETNYPTGETMSEGSAVPPKPDSMAAGEVCVPISSLASPGEDDQLQNPAIGDLVQFQTEGKVTRIDGENAYVKPDSINGKPVTAADAATTNPPEQNNDAEFAQLQQGAGKEMM